MTGTVGAFLATSLPEPHGVRAKRILRHHLEARGLSGPEPVSLAVIAGALSMQVAIAYLLRAQPWCLVAITAWCVGAFCNHGMYVMIHEAAHNLIFRRRWANELAAVVAECINVIPAAIPFRTYHLKDRAYQRVLELDTDLARPWEARVVGTSSIRKALCLLLFPLFALLRLARVRSIRLFTAWMCMNGIVVVLVHVLVLSILGPTALLYVFLCFLFSVSFQPRGARWIQEHYVMSPEQETYGYYGPLNRVAFNVGYHNAHHDFPAIAWKRLPVLERPAPVSYEPLIAHLSWARRWLQFAFDRHLSVFSRWVRTAPASNKGSPAERPRAGGRHAD